MLFYSHPLKSAFQTNDQSIEKSLHQPIPKRYKVISDYYNKMRDKTRKSNDKINTEMGLDSPLLKPSLNAFKKLFSEMNDHLTNNKWLSGDAISLADVSLVVYLTRLTSFQMSPRPRSIIALISSIISSVLLLCSVSVI